MFEINGISKLVQIPGENEFYIEDSQIGETFPATACGGPVSVRYTPGLDSVAIKAIAELNDIFIEAKGLFGYIDGDTSEIAPGIISIAIQFYTFER